MFAHPTMLTQPSALGVCLLLVLFSSVTLGDVLTPASAGAQQFPTSSSNPTNANPLPNAAASGTAAASVASSTPAAATPAAAPTPAAAAGAATASGSGPSVRLQPFNRVVSCVPFTILLTADATSSEYSATTSYNPEVAAAVLLKVEGKVLYVGFNKSYETKEAIKVTISLPPSQLLGIVSSGMGDVIVNPGFNTDYTVITNQGAGKVLARGITTNRLRVYLQGVGDVFAKGNIKEANITSQGTGRVTVSGVSQVVGGVQGISSVFVDPKAESSNINLAVQGISKVYYTRGQCKAASQMNIDVPFFRMDMGLSSCVKVQPAAFPRYKATWTCGTRVRGAAACAASARAAQAAAADSGDVSVSSETSNANNQEATVSVGDDNSMWSAAAAGRGTPGVSSSGGTPEAAAGAGDAAVARQAAAAGEVSIQAGRRRLRNIHHHFNHPATRKLDFFFDPMLPAPFVTASSSFNSESHREGSTSYADSDDGVFTWDASASSSSGPGQRSSSSSSSSSSDGDGMSVAVVSIECVTPQDQLYIPAV